MTYRDVLKLYLPGGPLAFFRISSSSSLLEDAIYPGGPYHGGPGAIAPIVFPLVCP